MSVVNIALYDFGVSCFASFIGAALLCSPTAGDCSRSTLGADRFGFSTSSLRAAFVVKRIVVCRCLGLALRLRLRWRLRFGLRSSRRLMNLRNALFSILVAFVLLLLFSFSRRAGSKIWFAWRLAICRSWKTLKKIKFGDDCKKNRWRKFAGEYLQWRAGISKIWTLCLRFRGPVAFSAKLLNNGFLSFGCQHSCLWSASRCLLRKQSWCLSVFPS